MEKNELTVLAKESGLEDNKIQGLLSRFGDSFKTATTAAEWSKTVLVTDESQTDLMLKAREARLKLKNVRVEVEHTRKELKEQSLREGKAIDGMANIIKAMIVPAEEHLEKQEKFAENITKERKARISAERLAQLMEYTDSPSMYSYESMEQEAFNKLVTDLKEANEAKEKAEKAVESERIAKSKAEAAEQERMRIENAKLKADAEAREAAIAKERAETQAKLDAERKAREAAEKIESDRKADEARKLVEQEETERKSLLAPDKEKLLSLANQLETLTMPNVSSREAGKVLDETKDFLERISKNLRSKAQEL